MPNNFEVRPPVAAGIGQINPDHVNVRLLKDVMDLIRSPVKNTLPLKRSGYPPEVFVVYQAMVQFRRCSPKIVGEWLNEACKDARMPLHDFHVLELVNGKQRRYFPDQPALSRFLRQMEATGSIEAFWNEVLFTHLLVLKRLGIVTNDLKLIADYKPEPCDKIKDDPYCFGTKEGNFIYKSLSFSIISRKVHQVIANYKIYKRQDKLPLFEGVVDRLARNGFRIRYALVDRGFYRKRLMKALYKRKITVIVPGKNYKQTKEFIRDYLVNGGSRYCRGFTKLEYVKGKGYTKLEFDVLLVAKRSYRLDQLKRHFKNGKLDYDHAARRIFPLVILKGNDNGIKRLKGNESYIRKLYRERWMIEIAFREMNRLGISTRLQGRDARLAILGAKSLLYNIWQVQRAIVRKNYPLAPALELNEFLGMGYKQRYPRYFNNVGKKKPP